MEVQNKCEMRSNLTPTPTYVDTSIPTLALNDNKSRLEKKIHEILYQLLKNEQLYDSETNWNISSLSDFSYGYSINVLFHIHSIPMINNKEYLLRIFPMMDKKSKSMVSHFVDRKYELQIAIKLGNYEKFGPFVYGYFNNGRIEHFYRNAKVIDPLIGYSHSELIAKKLSEMHKISLYSQHEYECQREIEILNNEHECNEILFVYQKTKLEGVQKRLHLWFNIAKNLDFEQDFNADIQKYNDYRNGFTSDDWKILDIEMHFIQEYLMPDCNIFSAAKNAWKIMQHNYQHLPSIFKSFSIFDVLKYLKTMELQMEFYARMFMYECVLCHNDVYVGNILEIKRDESSDVDIDIKLIDFEYATYNYRAIDFASFYGRCSHSSSYDQASETPEYGERIEFVWYYCKHLLNDGNREQYHWLNRNVFNSVENTAIFLNKCDCVILEFLQINSFLWGSWAIIQHAINPDQRTNHIKYARNRIFNQYNAMKNMWEDQYWVKRQQIGKKSTVDMAAKL